MDKMICGRVHHGPVAYDGFRCQCCGKLLTNAERAEYWRIRAQVQQLIRDVLMRYATHKRGKAA